MIKTRYSSLVVLSLILLLTQNCVENPVESDSGLPASGKVAYLSHGGFYDDPWTTQIDISNLDGTDPVQILHSTQEYLVTDFQFTPDGQYLIYKPDYQHINKVDMETMEISTVLEDSVGFIMDISISQNSQQLIYSDGYDIVRVDMMTGVSEILTAGLSETGNSCLDPEFSPDGSRIMYTYYISGLAPFHIYSMTTDGEDVRRIAEGKYGRYNGDGSKIVYNNHFANNETTSTFVVNSDGSSVQPITSLSLTDIKYMSFTPDSKHALYTETQGPPYNRDVMSINLKDLSIINETNSQFIGEQYPIYSPDGKDIFYIIGRYTHEQILYDAHVMRVVAGDNEDELIFSAEDIHRIAIQPVY